MNPQNIETRIPIPASPGKSEKHDYKYERRGTCNIFIAFEPLTGNRMVEVTQRRYKGDWAQFMEKIAGRYETARKINIVMDNLNTHEPGSFYEKLFRRIKQKYYGKDSNLSILPSMGAG